ncbi:MAG: efflux RND transporter periplasmic adaptor subunit [Pirellulales bacterium]
MVGNNDGNGLPESYEARADDEGGLRAPPHLHGWRKAWWWFDFIVLVKLARLRFIGILVVIGLVITQWDSLVAHYERWTRPKTEAKSAAADIEYFCPMHPTIVRDNGKEKCPICFMPLSKRKKGSGKAEALAAGVVNRVQLSPYRVVLAGIQTWPVAYEPLSKEITAVGYVEFNERGQRTVSARVKGRIDKLFVNETGQMVDAGDDLALLYSPELLVTEQNLLDAQRSGNQGLLQSAKTRLDLLGIDPDQVNEILAAGKAATHLRIRSPISGHVITKYVREGQYVDEGTPLYDLADLSTVWIQAQVYEDDLSFLPLGYGHGQLNVPPDQALEVQASTRALPDEVFRGKLAFIYPHADQDTRTVTVRFELENPEHKLRPGSTATVTLHVQPKEVQLLGGRELTELAKARLFEGKVLSIPESSVIDTGAQKIVYREASPGVYEGVEVVLGPRMARGDGANFYPVLSGLREGEKVVTSGSFLVDAETRLNPAAGSIYFGGSGGAAAGRSSVTSVRPSTPDDPDANVAAGLALLSPEDRKLAEEQRLCPVLAGSRLGSMGKPVKLTLEGRTVFVCCETCAPKALDNPQATLQKLDAQKNAPRVEPAGDAPQEELEIRATLGLLSPADRAAAEAQRYCAVLGVSRLGSMGRPVRIEVGGEPVFLCCKACEGQAKAAPAATLNRARKLHETNANANLR